MKILYILILCLFGTPAISADTPTPVATPVTCVVTEVSNGFVTLACPAPNKLDVILDIPVEDWPAKWLPLPGALLGRKFPAVWVDGHLRARPTSEWLIQQMTRERPDYQRNPVNQ